MTIRLDRPITRLATFFGPVTIGKFEDGTILIAGPNPNDEPILIRDGQLRRLKTHHPNGDMEFEGAVSAAGLLGAGQRSG